MNFKKIITVIWPDQLSYYRPLVGLTRQSLVIPSLRFGLRDKSRATIQFLYFVKPCSILEYWV